MGPAKDADKNPRKLRAGAGILVASYGKMKKSDRQDQIREWLGEDLKGAIAAMTWRRCPCSCPEVASLLAITLASKEKELSCFQLRP